MSFTLNNYWWLLIWLFTGGIFLAYVFPKKYEVVCGKQVRRWRMGPAIALALPYVLWAGWRSDVGDTYAYRRTFANMPLDMAKWAEYLATQTKDTGFSVLSLFIKTFAKDSVVIYFLVLAAFQIGCMVVLFRKYSCNYWMSIFVFIATGDYISWNFNGIRQFTAVMLIYITTDWLLEKKYIRVILMILLASTIHGSALLMIPIVFLIPGKAWNKWMMLGLFASVLSLIYVNQFTDILDSLLTDTQYTSMVTDWKEWEDDGMNPLRVLLYAVPSILSILGLKHIKSEDDPVINLCVNASVVSTAFSIIAMGTSSIFMRRLPIYVSLYANSILLPWEVENIFVPDLSKAVKVGSMLCYLVFFYYQMHFAWGML
jgi:transmembrane protein EpsG